MNRRFFSWFFWLFFGLTGLVNLLIAVFLALVTRPFDPDRRVNHLFSCLWGYSYVKLLPGWDTKVLHRDRIQPGRPYVLVANHTSLADIVLCFGLFRQFKWVSKAKNFSLPILGFNMRICRYVPLVRGEKESVDSMFAACRCWLEKGISVMMFPEGTRSKDGKLLPFKTGAFALARQMNVDVVPIAIEGGHELVRKFSGSLAPRAYLRVHVLEPIESSRFDNDEELTGATQARIAEYLEALPPHPLKSVD